MPRSSSFRSAVAVSSRASRPPSGTMPPGRPRHRRGGRRAAAMRAHRSPRAGRCLDHVATMADGIAVKSPSELTLAPRPRPTWTTSVTVTEEEISRALLLLLERAKAVVEPAGRGGPGGRARGQGRRHGPGCRRAVGRQRRPAAPHQAHRARPVRRRSLPGAARSSSTTARARWPRSRGRSPPSGLNVLAVEHHRAGRRPRASTRSRCLVTARDPRPRAPRRRSIDALRAAGTSVYLVRPASVRRPPRGTGRGAGEVRRPRRGRGPGGWRPSRRPASCRGPSRPGCRRALRTIWWQNDVASISKRSTPSPPVVPAGVEHPAHQRVVRRRPWAARQNDEKSCSPMSGSHASCMRAQVERLRRRARPWRRGTGRAPDG